MQFPDDVLALISAYSKPCSRPDWRNGGAFPSYLFYIGYDDYVNRHEFDSLVIIADDASSAEEFEFIMENLDMLEGYMQFDALFNV